MLLQCGDCDYKAKKRNRLNQHINVVHNYGKPFQCHDCEFKAKQKSNLDRHIKSVHKGEVFPCPDCSYNATQKSSLNIHITHKISSPSSNIISVLTL